MTMATRLVVMKDGLIQQIGTPKDVYNTPLNMFVAGFIGSPSMNLFHCRLTDTEILLGEQSFPIPSLYLSLLKEKDYLGKEIVMGIRPEDLQITDIISPYTFTATIDVAELLERSVFGEKVKAVNPSSEETEETYEEVVASIENARQDENTEANAEK